MFALEPNWGSLQAVGGRHFQMISWLGFLLGSGQGLSLWGQPGVQHSSHHCLLSRCHEHTQAMELAAQPQPPALRTPRAQWGGVGECGRSTIRWRFLPSPWGHPVSPSKGSGRACLGGWVVCGTSVPALAPVMSVWFGAFSISTPADS